MAGMIFQTRSKPNLSKMFRLRS